MWTAMASLFFKKMGAWIVYELLFPLQSSGLISDLSTKTCVTKWVHLLLRLAYIIFLSLYTDCVISVGQSAGIVFTVIIRLRTGKRWYFLQLIAKYRLWIYSNRNMPERDVVLVDKDADYRLLSLSFFFPVGMVCFNKVIKRMSVH